jgi:hypothetical protein
MTHNRGLKLAARTISRTPTQTYRPVPLHTVPVNLKRVNQTKLAKMENEKGEIVDLYVSPALNSFV